MAEWVSANFANLLPPGTEEILDTVRTLTDIVTFPLEAIATLLDAAKTLLLALPPFDFTAIVRDLIEDFKEDLLGTGYYMLDLWEYPVLQLQPSSYGPDNTYGSFDVKGGEFSEFVQTIADSFDDEHDVNKPQFSGSCAMMVFAVAQSNIDDLGIFIEDGNQGQTVFEGMSGSIQSASYSLHRARWQGALAKLRAVAENQSLDYAPTRVDRVQTAFRELSALSDDELDLLDVPGNGETEDRFYENIDIEDISWEDDVMPVLEVIEEARATSEWPDWRRASLKDIYPQLTDMVDEIFDPVLELLEVGRTIKEQIVEFIDSIKSKVEELTEIIDKIDDFLDRIEDFLNLTGFHVLFLTSGEGVSGLQDQLLAAGGDPLEGGKGWFTGFAILVGGDAVAPFQALFSPLAS